MHILLTLQHYSNGGLSPDRKSYVRKRDPFVARYNTNNEYNKDIVDIKSAPL